MSKSFSDQEWNICLKVLNALKDNPLDNPDNLQFKALITKIHKNAKKVIKESNYREPVEKEQNSSKAIHISHKNKKVAKRKADLSLLKGTQIAQLAINNQSNYSAQLPKNIVSADIPKVLNNPISCYVCKTKFDRVHFFYNRLCPDCAHYNYNRRFVKVDLTHRNAIITGGRVKIGYATSLMLLRSGANVIITSRFPALTLQQLEREPDYDLWKDKLVVYGLDLRNLYAVDEFVGFVKQHFASLDILINNAAQTIKYPQEHYAPLLTNEAFLLDSYKDKKQLFANSTSISDSDSLKYIDNQQDKLVEYTSNRFGQPIDHRVKNSWNSKLEQIDTFELLEVNLINHISPYIMIREFRELFLTSNFKERFIINVTSTEGQFSYVNKTIYHPHTNMTKAALNMLTRTSAEDFARDSIYMNSVDVGWVSTGAIEPLRQKQFERGYIPPLDSVDGAARIIHPIQEAIDKNNILYGVLLKDYKIVDW